MYLLKRGMHELAEAQLRRAVWLNPSEPAFKVHLAWCLYEQKRYTEAHDWAAQALAQKDDPRAREIQELAARQIGIPQ
jgi:Tfp pilus assembly protein PilF